MNKPKFKLQDSVRHIFGGPKLQIISIDGRNVKCAWKKADGEFEYETFDQDSLKLCERGYSFGIDLFDEKS